MALFFDREWFDGKLKALGFTQDLIASALGLSPDQIAEIWKDQRELSVQEVTTLAALLQETPSEIANRAGVSTPVPNDLKEKCPPSADVSALDEIKTRLARLEEAVDEIRALLRASSN